MALDEILPKAVRLFPTREAVVCGEVRMDYQTFAHRVWRLANGLRGLGVCPGDRVAVLHRNCHVFLEAYFGAAHAGAILVPLNFRLAPPELTDILADCGATVLIAQGEFRDKMPELDCRRLRARTVIWNGEGTRIHGWESLDYETLLGCSSDLQPSSPATGPDDVAHLYYTSGTTGRAKGVMLTHGNVQVHALGAIAELGITDSDRWFHVAPLFHLADAWATFAVTWAGGRHVLTPAFEPRRVFELMAGEGATLTNLIPTMLNLMVNLPGAVHYDVSSLRVILSGGASIAPETVRRITEIFRCEYVQTYGMTETSPYLTLSLLKEHMKELPAEEQLRIRSRTGREFITVELKVVDETGREVARDDRQVGEIIVRGSTVTPGYWNRPEETARTIRNGWLYTGDLAVMDREGYVNIVDRKKDMIVTGGENVYSTEVENVLYCHPDVLEAAVVGVPDSHWGETVKAFVVLREGRMGNEADIISHCRQRLAGYKTPRTVAFLDTLPRTGSGKIYKKGLRGY